MATEKTGREEEETVLSSGAKCVVPWLACHRSGDNRTARRKCPVRRGQPEKQVGTNKGK